jgi:hypothetical protein
MAFWPYQLGGLSHATSSFLPPRLHNRQTTANQERELRDIAARMGCEVVRVYKNHGISGAKGRVKRLAFDAMYRDGAELESFRLTLQRHTHTRPADISTRKAN